MNKFFPVLIIGLLQATVSSAQTDSIKWSLIADTSAVLFGNISAPVQLLSKTAVTSDTLSVRDYLGGTTTSGSPVGPAERIWCNGTFWPNESAQQNGRYIQFSVSPLPTYKFTVTSITFNIGELGSSSNKFSANVYYSTDTAFTVRTQLNPSMIAPSDAATTPLTTLSYSPGFVVDTGKTFYLRIYPWYSASSTSAVKYILLTNVVISGTTSLASSPSLIVSPSSLSFGTVNVNTSRDKSFTMSGKLLTPASGSLTVTAPAGFTVSMNNGSGYSPSLSVPYAGGNLNATTLYARFTPTVLTAYNDSISISGGGVTTQKLAVTGMSVASNTVLGIFVSTTGSDANTGTFEFPFATIPKALSVAQVGDTVFVRGGTYSLSTTITILTSGSDSSNRRYLAAYYNERPVLDFSSMPFSSSNRGMNLTGSYWHIKGFDFYRAGDNGMNITGSNNIIELCSFHENQDSGLQLSGTASNNRIINCDSYFNYDAPNAGGNADGFSPKQLTGMNNYFYGCRSWQNSDDGWDCYEAIATITIENCWSFKNGYMKNTDSTTSAMNGNGFKLGGNSTDNDAVVKNCLSFNNKSKGFDQNNNRGSMTLYNCTGYGNVGNNYSISGALDAGKTLTMTNCIELGNKRSLGSFAIQATNSWLNPPFTGASSNDFISIDTAGVRGPRKADGSLPDISFMHLARGSQFIDAGTNVGLPFNGSAPDLGCFESNYPTSVATDHDMKIDGFHLFQNYPNPFNPSTKITFSVGTYGSTSLRVYDVLGREVVTLMNEATSPGIYSIVWNADRMPSGIYFSRLTSNGVQQLRKMILMK